MRIGVVGGGIIGTTIAATLQKHFKDSSSPKIDITIIDDNYKRKHQTSRAGQGYLWSIHRTDDDLSRSLLAKEAWFDLLLSSDDEYNKDGTNGRGEQLLNQLFDPKQRGSLLIAATDEQKMQLMAHYENSELGITGKKQLQYIPCLTDSQSSHSLPWNFEYATKILKPGISGLYYPHDYTCSPPEIMNHLLTTYDEIKIEHRTVNSFEEERESFDIIICCTGPWMQELCPDVEIIPVRGVLLLFEKADKFRKNGISHVLPPMMEVGYGSMGYHFTLSSRTNDNQWLLGASREHVQFDTSSKDINMVTENLMKHAEQFINSNQVFSDNMEKRVGFRPSPSFQRKNKTDFAADKKGKGYTVEKRENGLILSYGFEGQGVLYAALAAREVLALI